VKKTLIITAAAVATLTLAGCATDNFKDVKGVPNVHPDYVLNVENMDKHPNIGFLCIAGAPVLTTTRSYNALSFIPREATYAWQLCAAKAGKHVR
jgi:hypothetical protein